MENLDMFRARTAFESDCLPAYGGLDTMDVPSLRVKVNEQGDLIPIHGNTVVFLLGEEERCAVEASRRKLMESCADLFTPEWLKQDTFHMTLHDLENGAPGGEINARMDAARGRAQEILRKMDFEPIRMRPTWAFSMVNTSVVLGLEPETEDDCLRLMALYEQFHEVVMPGYPFLTPHITLAYYRRGHFSEEQLRRLRDTLSEVNGCERRRREGRPDFRAPFILKRENLVYQEFTDMNHYRTIG